MAHLFSYFTCLWWTILYNHNPHITGIISEILTLKRQDGGPISIADTLRDDVDSPLELVRIESWLNIHGILRIY